MPVILLLLFPLGLASEDEDGEVAFLASFPSEKKHFGNSWVEASRQHPAAGAKPYPNHGVG